MRKKGGEGYAAMVEDGGEWGTIFSSETQPCEKGKHYYTHAKKESSTAPPETLVFLKH